MSHTRTPWLDDKGESVLIDDYARELGTFLDALADGRIDKHELDAAEKRLVTLLKEVEPQLSDKAHEQVTRLLVEVSAYSVMQTLAEIEGAKIRSLKL